MVWFSTEDLSYINSFDFYYFFRPEKLIVVLFFSFFFLIYNALSIVRKNKKLLLYVIVYIFFGVIGRKIKNLKYNIVFNIIFSEIILILLKVMSILTGLIILLFNFFEKIKQKSNHNKEISFLNKFFSRKSFIFIPILVCWFPVYLTCFPGV